MFKEENITSIRFFDEPGLVRIQNGVQYDVDTELEVDFKFDFKNHVEIAEYYTF